MADTRYSCGGGRDMICIDTYRVLDSCRDKDCFEDVRVYLGACGNEILGRASNIRAKSAKVLWSCIDIDSVPFNRGFYQLLIRIYVKIVGEACLGPGNIQEFDGVAAVEKKVILFGGEGNVSVFESELEGLGCCGGGQTAGANTLPVAVFEVVDPIVLDSKILNCSQPCQCCCSCDEIPERVCASVSAPPAPTRGSCSRRAPEPTAPKAAGSISTATRPKSNLHPTKGTRPTSSPKRSPSTTAAASFPSPASPSPRPAPKTPAGTGRTIRAAAAPSTTGAGASSSRATAPRCPASSTFPAAHAAPERPGRPRTGSR